MGARRISDRTNEQIIALMSMGKTIKQVTFATGASSSYCNKLYTVVKYIANEKWSELIEYCRYSTAGGVITWACEYLNTKLPKEVEETIKEVRYHSPKNKSTEAAPKPESSEEPFDNSKVTLIEILEKLDAVVTAITEAADDICQTVATARKLNEDCINANFDVLTAKLRDGVESVKTTIRKGRS